MSTPSKRRSLAVAVALGLVIACGPEPEPPAPPAERVENAGLGIAIANLAPTFRVASNDDSGLVLEPLIEGAPTTGTLELLAGEPGSSTNLVAAVNQHAEDIAALAGGAYQGQRELGSPLGTAFYSRGRFDDGGAPTEETVIFAVHPDGDRILRLRYRYPAGEDSTERLRSLFDILGELEGVFSAEPDAAS